MAVKDFYFFGSYNAYRPFILTVDSGADARYTIPTSGGGYNYSVNTSDGQFFNGVTGNKLIVFPLANTLYDIEIRGLFPRIYVSNNAERLKVRNVKQWGDIKWKSMQNAFFGCSNLIISATGAPDLSNVTDMSAMFYNCTAFNSDISNWNVSNVRNMSYMFYNCTSLTALDVSNWNVGNVTNMAYMFASCASLTTLDVSTWNVSNVTSMRAMFQNCKAVFSVNWANISTGSVSLTDASGILAGAKITSLKLQAGNLVEFINVTGNPSNPFASSNLTELILIDCPVNIPLTGFGLGSAPLMSVTAIDNLANSVADLTGLPTKNITITLAQRVGINELLWTNKNWTIIAI